MAEPRPKAPTRSDLWFWLVIAGVGLLVVTIAHLLRASTGPAVFEVLYLPVVLFGWLAARTLLRLIRRDHRE